MTRLSLWRVSVRYKNIHEGLFLERMHRFGAIVEIEGHTEYVHVKNTGRCREILVPGTRVFLEKKLGEERKTRYSLISALRGNLLINIDSQVPNTVVHEAITNHQISEFKDITYLKREKSYGKSRFDLYFERDNGSRGFIEIKGVTLDSEGKAMFPDAPTKRGLKHLNELSYAKAEGYESYVIFLVQYSPVRFFTPNQKTDPDFAEGLKNAVKSGVIAMAFDSHVNEDSISLGTGVEIRLNQGIS